MACVICGFSGLGKTDLTMHQGLIICGFPGLGKTYLTMHQELQTANNRVCDVDFGKVRDIFGLRFDDDHDNVRFIHARQLYVAMINYVVDRGYTALINDPYIEFTSIRGRCVFAIPSYDREEWLKRVKMRGDDLSSPWILDIYDNYDRYIADWEGIAHNLNCTLYRVSYLSELFAQR